MARHILWGTVFLSRQTLMLAVGDAAMIAVFVTAGQLRHGNPLLAGLDTFTYFAIGWLIVATIAGAYTDHALDTPRYAGTIAIVGWTGGAILAQVLRIALGVTTGFVPVFMAVAIATGSVLLTAWRLIATRLLPEPPHQ